MEFEIEQIKVEGHPVDIEIETNEDEISKTQCGTSELLAEVSKIETKEDRIDKSECGILQSSQINVFPSFNTKQKLDPAKQSDHNADETEKSNCKCMGTMPKCKDCKFKNEYKRNLEMYEKTRPNEDTEMFRCIHCLYESTDRQAFVNHMKTEHTDKEYNPTGEMYMCNICSFTTPFKKLMHLHKSAHHGDNDPVCIPVRDSIITLTPDSNKTSKKFECKKCGCKMEFLSEVAKHMKLYHDRAESVHKCEECDYTTKYKGTLASHVKVKHETHCIVFRCMECTYESNYREYLMKHVKVKHEETNKIYKCKKCRYSSKDEKDWKRHLKRRDHQPSESHQYSSKDGNDLTGHGDTWERYKCEKCPYHTNNVTYMSLHMRREHGSHTRYKCEKCEFTTNSKRNLLYHETAEHDKTAGTVFSCEKCSYSTKKLGLLQRHIKVKHAVSYFKCVHCRYECKEKISIIRHTRKWHAGLDVARSSDCSVKVKMEVDEDETGEAVGGLECEHSVDNSECKIGLSQGLCKTEYDRGSDLDNLQIKVEKIDQVQ